MKNRSVEKRKKSLRGASRKGFGEDNKQWWDVKRGAHFTKEKYGKFYYQGRMEK